MILRMIRLGFILMLVGAVAAALLGMTYAVTKDRIAEQKRLEEAKACMEALPSVKSADELKQDGKLEKLVKKDIPDVQKIYRCGEGFVFVMSSKGYGGPILMAVGVDNNGKTMGISVISQNETPGLGGNVTKPEFLDQFKGKTPADPVEVGADIQGITGATMTSKAATGEVRDALEAYQIIKKSGA